MNQRDIVSRIQKFPKENRSSELLVTNLND